METLADRIDRAAAGVAAVLAELADASTLLGSGDAELLEMTGRAEGLGRSADAIRVFFADEVGDRSRRMLGPAGLASRMGCANAAELITRIARVSTTTARSRMMLGERVRPVFTLHGELVPAPYPEVRQALTDGVLGVDSATVITKFLDTASVGLPTDAKDGIHAAEHELVCSAVGTSPDGHTPAAPPVTPWEIEVAAATWASVLRPDGAEPSTRVFASRGFGLGRERDGIIPVHGALLPEVAGIVQRVLDTLTNPRQSLRFLTDEARAALEASGARDERTRAQRQHDALATIFDVAGRAAELPTLGGASATMVVTVNHADLAAGEGVGQVDGIDAPICLSAVRQLCCANGIQPIQLAGNGRVLRIGTTERNFNRAQRRAIAARDGGCIIPGCPIPAWGCEVHHVLPWERVQRTHVDNGVMLCWFHHRTIETSGWQIRMTDGAPQIKPPPWLGDPVWRPAPGSKLRQADTIRARLRT